MGEQEKIPFTEHLEELRKRLIVCFIAVGVGFVLSYGFKEKLFQILTRPLIRVLYLLESRISFRYHFGRPGNFLSVLDVCRPRTL